MSLTAPRPIVSRQTNPRSIPVMLADGYTCYTGGILVIRADGYCEPAQKASGLVVAGVLAPKSGNLVHNDKTVTPNSGQQVASEVIVGVFDFDNGTSTDAITQADVGNTCYLLDDHTLTRLSSGASAAGKIVAVNNDGTIQVDIAFATVLNQ